MKSRNPERKKVYFNVNLAKTPSLLIEAYKILKIENIPCTDNVKSSAVGSKYFMSSRYSSIESFCFCCVSIKSRKDLAEILSRF